MPHFHLFYSELAGSDCGPRSRLCLPEDDHGTGSFFLLMGEVLPTELMDPSQVFLFKRKLCNLLLIF